jgi:phage-related protein (TIGR01555 family)
MAHPIRWLGDSLVNFVTGLGTQKDPTTNSFYQLNLLNRNDLENAYRGDWIARRVVDAPAEDATREWRSWQAKQADIEKIENLEKKHDLQRKMRQAIVRARLYGGAALVMGVENGEIFEPVDLDTVGLNDLRFIAVMNKYELSAGPRIYDVESEWYTRPEYYAVSTPIEGMDLARTPNLGQVQVHPSRVIEFSGNELPDWRLAPLGGGWGDSVLQSMDEMLKDWGLTIGGIANMVNDGKMDVVKIPQLSEKLTTSKHLGKLIERFTLANQAKSSINTLLLDKEEDWDRVQTNFSGLPNLINALMPIIAGAGGIPVSRLMGQAPGKGLSHATSGGESDLRNYYDDVTSKQKTVYSPAMATLDQVLVRSALGKSDPSIYYDWTPLYQPDPKELADIAFVKAQATNLDVQMGLINEDALRKARVNQLIEDGTYPGLDEAIDEFGMEPPQPTPEEIAAHAALMGKSQVGPDGKPLPKVQNLPGERKALPKPDTAITKDAAPRTLYVRRDVLNADAIVKWAKAQGIATTLPTSDMHVTVAFSRQPVDWMRAEEVYDRDGQLLVSPSGVRMVERFGDAKDCVVLLFNSGALSRRHDALAEIGASWDWPEYQPHVTISYKVPQDLDVTKIEPYRGPIVLGPEIFETVNEDWKSTIKEDAMA